jgi:hypothetical protein
MHLVNKFLFVSLIVPSVVYAQTSEIAINLSSFSTVSNIIDTSIKDQFHAYGFGASTTISFTKLLKNDHFWEAGIGYDPNNQYSTKVKKMTDGVINYDNISKTKRRNQSGSILLGYGFCNQIQKLQLRSSFKFTTRYIQRGTYFSSIENIDSIGNIGAYQKYAVTDGYDINLGLFASQQFIYPIYKRFLICVDFNIGINNDNFFGAQIRTLDSYNLGVYSNEYYKDNYYKVSTYYIHFYPGISVKYAFGK